MLCRTSHSSYVASAFSLSSFFFFQIRGGSVFGCGGFGFNDVVSWIENRSRFARRWVCSTELLIFLGFKGFWAFPFDNKLGYASQSKPTTSAKQLIFSKLKIQNFLTQLKPISIKLKYPPPPPHTGAPARHIRRRSCCWNHDLEPKKNS